MTFANEPKNVKVELTRIARANYPTYKKSEREGQELVQKAKAKWHDRLVGGREGEGGTTLTVCTWYDLFSSFYFHGSQERCSLDGKTKRAFRESVSNFPHRRKHDQSCPRQRGPSRSCSYRTILTRTFRSHDSRFRSPFLSERPSLFPPLSTIMNF